MEKIKLHKWWWGWQYEMIEAWLEDRALNGYKLEKVTGMGEIFHFTKADPQKVRYCVDYQPKLTTEYMHILEDDGWSYISIPGNWIICCKEYDDIKPELFNDYDSIINRNNKLLLLCACLLAPLAGMYMLIFSFRDNEVLTITISIFYALANVFYVFCIACLIGTNKALKLKKDMQNK